MSPEAYYDDLAEVALGWLGWTEAEALAADVNAIKVAYAGRVDLLRTVFGGSKAGTSKQQGLTPQLFDAMYGRARKKP